MASAYLSSTTTSVPATGSSRGPALPAAARKPLSSSGCMFFFSRLHSQTLRLSRSSSSPSWTLPRAQYEIESVEATDTLSPDPPSEPPPPPEGPKLYVGNLSWNCTSQDLAEHFQGVGTVEMVEVILDRETNRSRGFAFVTMRTLEEANEAIARFDGSEFMGRRMRVSFPDRSPRPPPSANKLFVGNLPWGMDDITLESLFTEHGNVLEARVVYDRDSGRSRGFGFVTLSSSDEVNEAISKMDGAEVQGRPLRVNLASDRPPPRQSFM